MIKVMMKKKNKMGLKDFVWGVRGGKWLKSILGPCDDKGGGPWGSISDWDFLVLVFGGNRITAHPPIKSLRGTEERDTRASSLSSFVLVSSFLPLIFIRSSANSKRGQWSRVISIIVVDGIPNSNAAFCFKRARKEQEWEINWGGGKGDWGRREEENEGCQKGGEALGII